MIGNYTKAQVKQLSTDCGKGSDNRVTEDLSPDFKTPKLPEGQTIRHFYRYNNRRKRNIRSKDMDSETQDDLAKLGIMIKNQIRQSYTNTKAKQKSGKLKGVDPFSIGLVGLTGANY